MIHKKNLIALVASFSILPVIAADTSKSSNPNLIDYPNKPERMVNYTPPASPKTSPSTNTNIIIGEYAFKKPIDLNTINRNALYQRRKEWQRKKNEVSLAKSNP